VRIRVATLAAVATLALAATACGSHGSAQSTAQATGISAKAPTVSATPAGHYADAQAIAAALKASGYAVGPLKADTSGYVAQVGGKAYQMSLPAGPAGIDVFPNADALAVWVKLSRSLGGVAVTGDVWAVSLPTDGKARDASLTDAPAMAKALGGTVQK
jgi:hypothetical protein